MMTLDFSCLFLIGYRGSGKTTVGRLLAERMGWNFIDADDILEKQYGRSIREIFETHGEEVFRDQEMATLVRLCEFENIVIATGGGVVLREVNRSCMKKHGRVVWLTADTDTIVQRLAKDETTADRRPNLSVGGKTEIAETLQHRQHLYEMCADHVVSTIGKSAREVADFVWSQIANASSRSECGD